MIKRVSTFPCSHSVTTWLHGIFTKLESDSQVLACILRHLGTNNVPQELFHLCRIASPTWGLDGETMGIAARGIPIIQHESLFTAALHGLKRVGFVYTSQTAIRLDPKLAVLLKRYLQAHAWAIKAAKIVIYAFPKYRNIDPMKYVLVH